MSTHNLSRWTAQEPPDDFADRTVRAMLAAREEPVRPRRRGWLGGLGLAAVLLGATAWGMLEAQSRAVPDVVMLKLARAVRQETPPAAGRGKARPQEEETPEASKKPEREAKVRPPVRTQRRVAPPTRRAPGGREPMCHCEADMAVCGCLE
jgi:hypothetical protein